MQIFRICHIANFWNFQNYKFLEISKLNFFWICKIANFWNFRNWNFFDFFKLDVFGIVQIGKLINLNIFSIWKIKVWLQKLAILEFFVHSIFRTTRNFANSHISTFISYSSGNFLDWQVHEIIKFLKLFNFKN